MALSNEKVRQAKKYLENKKISIKELKNLMHVKYKF